MRKIILAASIFLQSAVTSFAEDPYATPQGAQLVGNQWVAPQVAPQPYSPPPQAYPAPAPAYTPPATVPSPLAIDNAWNVMQYNFGM